MLASHNGKPKINLLIPKRVLVVTRNVEFLHESPDLIDQESSIGRSGHKAFHHDLQRLKCQLESALSHVLSCPHRPPFDNFLPCACRRFRETTRSVLRISFDYLVKDCNKIVFQFNSAFCDLNVRVIFHHGISRRPRQVRVFTHQLNSHAQSDMVLGMLSTLQKRLNRISKGTFCPRSTWGKMERPISTRYLEPSRKRLLALFA